MSIKTTHAVTRDFALNVIKLKLEDSSNTQLENILEEVIHNGFYNFIIVNNQEDLKEFSYTLTDLNNLPNKNDAY